MKWSMVKCVWGGGHGVECEVEYGEGGGREHGVECEVDMWQ